MYHQSHLRATAYVACIAVIVAACLDSTSPPPPAIRGIVFADSVSGYAVQRLSVLGTVLAVVRRADIVLVSTQATPATLVSIPGVTRVGPILGTSDSLQVLVEVTYPDSIPSDAVRTLQGIGTVTRLRPKYATVDLEAPIVNLGKLDALPKGPQVWIEYDPNVPQ